MTAPALRIEIVGAGLAGLAAACRLTECGHRVVLREAAPFAGGRARSYEDKQLGCRIDNGNHLLLSGNVAALNYLHRIGAKRALTGPAAPSFPFFDLQTKEHWTLRLNQSRFPWWIFSSARRVPGTQLRHYAALLKLRKAGPADLVAPLLQHAGPLYRRLLEPLAIAALNTMPEEAAASLLAAVTAETIERGGALTIPRFAKLGLSECFVDPALEWLRQRGAEIRFGDRVTELTPGQPAILAVPPWEAARLLPGLTVPNRFESICNLHFACTLPPGEAGFYGLLGGIAEWVFCRPNIASVTISAANRHAHLENEVIANLVWGDLCAAFGLTGPVPPHRVVWEKRASFLATPEQLARRPAARTANPLLFLAGDWTDTGLPATIEGAIRSGNAAAMALMQELADAPVPLRATPGLDTAVHLGARLPRALK